MYIENKENAEDMRFRKRSKKLSGASENGKTRETSKNPE